MEAISELNLERNLSNAILAKIATKPTSASGFKWIMIGETIGTGLLVWAAWPIIETSLFRMGLADTTITLPQLNIDLPGYLSQLLSDVAIWFNNISPLFEINWIQLNEVSIYLIPLVLSAGLLMIFGNQILLKDIRSKSYR
jgi:hypothetical protein